MSSRRDPEGNESSSRQNVYFIPRDGIDREVITSDICRYLGNDALVRPGTFQDPQSGTLLQGYHITAYRNLTSAMIQSLKEDSARWDNERRTRTGNRKSGPSSASSYEISEKSFPKGSSRDSYEIVLPRYPGSSAPGYSGSGFQQQQQQQQQYQQPQYDDRQDPRQPVYQPGQYNPGQQPSNQAVDPRYVQHPGGAYSGPAYGGQYAAEPPYVNVGAHQHAQQPSDRTGGYPAASYPAGTAYAAPGHDARYGYAQPVDPHYGRSNSQYPATSQADYSSVTPATYGYDYQTANPAPAQPQTPSTHVAVSHAAVQDPRATTSSPVGTQAQTGYSAPSSSSRHRDRSDREHRDSRHSRR